MALVLSREAGAADELGEDALLVNPYDVSQTAEALHAALSMPADERRARSARMAARATALPPAAWLAEQLEELERTEHRRPTVARPSSTASTSPR